MDSGVLLFNLGGPETLADVRPFLLNLFSDPDIIRIKNDTVRRIIARIIVAARQEKSRGLYRQIGGGSPSRGITEAQAAALTARLAARGFPARVYIGMRCWKPSIDEAIARIAADRISRLILLPLFPQYSVTTTGSCFNYFQAAASRAGLRPDLKIVHVEQWFEEPLYLDSVCEKIREAQQRFSSHSPEEIHLLYTAHSIPARYVEQGDPYLDQTRRTIERINERLGGEFKSTLAFQSKVGPVKWLEPATSAVIQGFPGQGIDKVLAVPISFVSDHLETLQEIDISYRELAARAGIKEFHRAPSLNTSPTFIEALANITLSAAAEGST